MYFMKSGKEHFLPLLAQPGAILFPVVSNVYAYQNHSRSAQALASAGVSRFSKAYHMLQGRRRRRLM